MKERRHDKRIPHPLIRRIVEARVLAKVDKSH
jgi:hypothetical protein